MTKNLKNTFEVLLFQLFSLRFTFFTVDVLQIFGYANGDVIARRIATPRDGSEIIL